MSTALSVGFEELVADVSAGNNKIQRMDYLPAGAHPIVDQGQELIGGYSNSSEDLVGGGGPWVVFGDHTRAIKYLDQPFCMGADGVKVLRPRSSERLDPKYLYHFLVAHPVPSAGYSRHFKFLKKLAIPLPPIAEQRRIAAILDKADALRRKRKRALELLDGLTQSIFLEMFGDPIANSRRVNTAHLQDVVSAGRKITYGILKPGPDLPDGVPYVRVVDIKDGRIDVDGLRRTSTSIAEEYRRSTLKAGDLLISIRGHVGRMAVTPIECEGANITQDTARLAIEGADTEFVKAQLETEAAQNWMARRTKGAAVKGINLGDLKLFPLMLPPLSKQCEFARRVTGLQRKASAAAQQSRTLDLLFASLQHRAFSGQL